MIVEIEETICKEIKREIELPYYYKHELELENTDSIIYGKVENESHSTIIETCAYDTDEIFELSISPIYSVGFVDSSVFSKDKVSTKEEYEDAKMRCAEFMNKL